ncbi:TolC family protein [Opitutia bacterium ISCC 51]|nr:TolC family protein [Opitutae bacterium ISCC 51]QXD29374.1 TolC family protein [Opitutae bacterium ISCC 52]
MKLKSLIAFLISSSLVATSTLVHAEVMQIDLTSALRLANDQNTELAIQLERVKRAEIGKDIAWHQWLPTVRAGFGTSDQNGPLQNTNGSTIDADRKASSKGFGLPTVGSGLAPKPGLALELDLAEGIFQPLAATQKLKAAQAEEIEARQNLALEVAGAYYELVQSQRQMAIAAEASDNASNLAKVTADFAEAGEGLQADAERAAVESLIQQNNLESARMRSTGASSRLVQLLRLNESVELAAVDSMIVPLNLFPMEPQLDSLINKALANRPELKRYEALVKAEQATLKQESWGLLIPKLGATYSDTQYKGRISGTSSSYDDRDETSVALYWELENLGFTSWAKKESQQSRLREAQARELQAESDIIADVNLALAQYRAAGKQVEFLKQAVDRARKAFDLSTERIYENQGLPLEALQAMKALEQVESMYLIASAQRNLSQLYLLAATGDEI